MKKRVLAAVIVGGLSVMSLSACSYESMGRTPDEFTANVESHGLSIEDKTDQKTDDSFKKILVAKNEGETCNFQYDLMENEGGAEKAFEYILNGIKEAYKKDEEAGNTAGVVVVDEGEIYSVDCDRFYCFVATKDNTIIYAVAKPEGKDLAKTIISELAYDQGK